MKKRYIIGLIVFILLAVCAVYAAGNEEGQRQSVATQTWGSDENEDGFEQRIYTQNEEHIDQYKQEAEQAFREENNMAVQVLTQVQHQLECEDRLYEQGELELPGGFGVCE